MARFTTLATTAALAVATLGAGQMASANSITHFQGFETDSFIWNGSGGIARVPSGGGTLGVSSSSGSHHAEITEGGSSDGGYTFFGGSYSTYTGSVVQSLDIYIDLDWADPTGGGDGFKLNMFPSSTSGASISEAGEQFLFSFTADGLNVEANGLGGYGSSITTLTSEGWYTFEATFRKGTDGFIKTDLAVYNFLGDLLGVQTRGGGDNSVLGGHGYIWVSNWVDGFADNTLAIDNARAYAVSVPEPASLALLAIGAGMMLMMRRARRRDAS